MRKTRFEGEHRVESTEKPIHTIEPLTPPYFLERVDVNRQADFWLGGDKAEALKKAERIM